LRVIGETDASIQLHLETIESFPEFFPAHYHLAFSYIDAGRLNEAGVQCEQAVALSHENSLTLSLQGILQTAMGNTAAVKTTLDKLLRMKDEKYISSANIATVYAAMEDEAKTLEWLERGLEERDPNMTWIKSDREFKFLHDNDRFRKILQKVGLADTDSSVIPESVPATLSWSLIVAGAIVTVLVISLVAIYFLEVR